MTSGEGVTLRKAKGLILASAAVLAMAGLAGCSQSPSEQATNEVDQNVAGGNQAAPAVAPAPVDNLAENVTENAADPLPPEKPVPVDQQTLDDASATGMTSHVARDQEPGAAQ
jgi:hypothetical protein